MCEAMTCRHLLDCDEIDTNGFFFDFLFHTIPPDSKKKTTFFRAGKSLDSTSVTLTASVFYLKKDGNPVFFRDNIHFSSFRCNKIGFDDFVVMFLKVIYSEKFRFITNSSGRKSHDFNIYSIFTFSISFILLSEFTFGL